MTMEGVQQAIKTAGERMGYFTLKDEQRQTFSVVGMASFAFQLGMESHSVTPFCLGHSMSYRE